MVLVIQVEVEEEVILLHRTDEEEVIISKLHQVLYWFLVPMVVPVMLCAIGVRIGDTVQITALLP